MDKDATEVCTKCNLSSTQFLILVSFKSKSAEELVWHAAERLTCTAFQTPEQIDRLDLLVTECAWKNQVENLLYTGSINDLGSVNMQWKILIPCHRSPIKFCDLDSSNCTIKISYWAPFNYKPRLIVHLSVVCDSRTPVGQGVGRAAARQTRS